MSLIASAKRCQVEPWAWLNEVLRELPKRLATQATTKGSFGTTTGIAKGTSLETKTGTTPETATGPPDLSDLLPDIWLKNHPEHRWEIDSLRQKERQRSKNQKANSN
ncbi:MAG: transposase domain-containing protein [Planctomycetes bacterium]|nr:transposase domain-containing protein [Planctomycetota bacterium]